MADMTDLWRKLREALLDPRTDSEALSTALRQARERQPLPVIWLIGKTQAGKTSIIRALTGSEAAEIGNGFQPCTRTSRFYDFPAEAPVVRFLDTRGLGEVAYDPAEDMRYCESQAHLVLGVIKAADIRQDQIFEVLRAVRQRHPEWPVLIAQTGLHELYPRGGEHRLPYPYDQKPLPPQVPNDLARALSEQRQRLGRLPGLGPVRWVPVDLTLPEDGWEPASYGLDALWAAIEAISSLHLQSLLRGDAEVQDAYARVAHPHIVGHAVTAGGLGALPLVEMIGVPAVQAKLLHVLAKLYGQRWDKRSVTEFLGLLGVGVGLGYVARMLGRQVTKLIPVLGQTAGAMWGATANSATTYALGKAATYYFSMRKEGGSVDPKRLRRIYMDGLASGLNLLKSNVKDRPS